MPLPLLPLALGGLALWAFGRKGAAPKTDIVDATKFKPKVDAAQTNNTMKDVGAGIGLGVSVVTAIAAAWPAGTAGGTSLAATGAGAGTAAGGAGGAGAGAGGSGGITPLTGGALIAAEAIAIAIVVVWVVMVSFLVAELLTFLRAESTRKSWGKDGVLWHLWEQCEKVEAHAVIALVNKYGGHVEEASVQEPIPGTNGGMAPQWRIVGVSGIDQSTLKLIVIMARYLAIEQARETNRAIRSFSMAQGYSVSAIAADGRAISDEDFDAFVAAYYARWEDTSWGLPLGYQYQTAQDIYASGLPGQHGTSYSYRHWDEAEGKRVCEPYPALKAMARFSGAVRGTSLACELPNNIPPYTYDQLNAYGINTGNPALMFNPLTMNYVGACAKLMFGFNEYRMAGQFICDDVTRRAFYWGIGAESSVVALTQAGDPDSPKYISPNRNGG